MVTVPGMVERRFQRRVSGRRLVLGLRRSSYDRRQPSFRWNPSCRRPEGQLYLDYTKSENSG